MRRIHPTARAIIALHKMGMDRYQIDDLLEASGGAVEVFGNLKKMVKSNRVLRDAFDIGIPNSLAVILDGIWVDCPECCQETCCFPCEHCKPVAPPREQTILDPWHKGDPSDGATLFGPGTIGKINVMRERYLRGEPVFHSKDARDKDYGKMTPQRLKKIAGIFKARQN